MKRTATITISLLMSIIGLHAQRIETFTLNDIFLSTAGTPSIGSDVAVDHSFTITEPTPLILMTSPIVNSNGPRGPALVLPETTAVIMYEIFLLNVDTNITTNIISITRQSHYDSPNSIYSVSRESISGNVGMLTPGNYQIRHRRIGSAPHGYGLQNQLNQIKLTGPSTMILAQAISPEVQAALNALQAAMLAGDAALTTQLTTLANEMLTLESQVTTLTTQITALQSENTSQQSEIDQLQTELTSTQSLLNSRYDELHRIYSNLNDTVKADEDLSKIALGIGAGGLATGLFNLFNDLNSVGPSPKTTSIQKPSPQQTKSSVINRNQIYKQKR